MSLKNWILRKMNGLATRADLPRSAPRSPVLSSGDVGQWGSTGAEASAAQRATTHPAKATAPRPIPHLGPYAPLINAIREELEHFANSHLRLHLAIAEHDRYLLTSIHVQATGRDDDAELLGRFVLEFRPEQIKEYLAREIIGALPNASAIELSQFAGLNADRAEASDEDDSYSKLLAELRDAAPGPAIRPFEVNLIGRWSTVGHSAATSSGARTPMVAPEIEVAIEDADGARRVRLTAVMPGRRYSIGKGEGCDIVVNGVYASRRHCEVWLDRGMWWISDTGSTNGVRVERAGSVTGRSVSDPGAARGVGASSPAVIEVMSGARIVLSARAEGSASDYPRLTLDAGRDAAVRPTPIAPAIPLRATPTTPIRGGAEAAELMLAAHMASGATTVELHASELPFSVGRSRNQGLVIDWTHEGVSGHHIDITSIDEQGATVTVYGDNGVSIAGELHPPGARVHWAIDRTMVLGRVVDREPECRLTISRRSG